MLVSEEPVCRGEGSWMLVGEEPICGGAGSWTLVGEKPICGGEQSGMPDDGSDGVGDWNSDVTCKGI